MKCSLLTPRAAVFQFTQFGLQMLLIMYIPTLHQIITLLFYCFKYLYSNGKKWKKIKEMERNKKPSCSFACIHDLTVQQI